jgi:hypothetical protein
MFDLFDAVSTITKSAETIKSEAAYARRQMEEEFGELSTRMMLNDKGRARLETLRAKLGA